MAFTHIPLMPAGDVASGVETSRGLGAVSTEEKPSLVQLIFLFSRNLYAHLIICITEN